jgi:hypothetical protein
MFCCVVLKRRNAISRSRFARKMTGDYWTAYRAPTSTTESSRHPHSRYLPSRKIRRPHRPTEFTSAPTPPVSRCLRVILTESLLTKLYPLSLTKPLSRFKRPYWRRLLRMTASPPCERPSPKVILDIESLHVAQNFWLFRLGTANRF